MKKSLTLLLFVFLSLTTALYSQQNTTKPHLFTKPDQSVLPVFPTGEQNIITKAAQLYGKSNVYVIRQNDFYQVIKGGNVKVTIPGINCEPTFVCKSLISDKDGNLNWLGNIEIEEAPEEEKPAASYSQCWDGSILLNIKGSRLSGMISLTDDFFEIYSVNDTYSVLVRTGDQSSMQGIECGNETTNQGSNAQDTPISVHKKSSDSQYEKTQSTCPIKILALFTPSARDVTVNIEEYIRLTVMQTQLGTLNSDVSNQELSLELASLAMVDPLVFTPTVTGIAQDDIDALTTNAAFIALRDANAADIVLVFTGDDYPNSNISGIVGGFLDRDKSNAIIVSSFPLFRTVVPHEIGHIFGALHQKCSRCIFLNMHLCPTPFCEDDVAGVVSHATWFRTAWWPISNRKHTILDAGEDVEKRLILNYSNPDVFYAGESTGTSGENNASKLKSSACDVANFRDSGNEFRVTIDAPDIVCECAMLVSASADIQGGVPGIIQYDWSISLDADMNFIPLSSSLNSVQFGMNCGNGSEGVMIRVLVTDQNGDSFQDMKFIKSTTVEAESGVYCQFARPAIDNPINTVGEVYEVEVFPNPSEDVIHLSFPKLGKYKSVSLIPMSGSNSKDFIKIDPSTKTIDLDISSKPPGLYLILLSSDEGIETRKVIVR